MSELSRQHRFNAQKYSLKLRHGVNVARKEFDGRDSDKQSAADLGCPGVKRSTALYTVMALRAVSGLVEFPEAGPFLGSICVYDPRQLFNDHDRAFSLKRMAAYSHPVGYASGFSSFCFRLIRQTYRSRQPEICIFRCRPERNPVPSRNIVCVPT